MEKLQRSWVLLKSSLSVIGRNKQLLVFPIVTFICTVAILFFFLAGPLLRPTGYSYVSAQHWQAISHSLFTETGPAAGHSHHYALSPMAIGYLALMYFVSMFLATFFNVAFYHEIIAALSGDTVLLGRGLGFAASRWKAVLMWTLLAGLVGLIIKVIEQRLELVGRILARVIGIAWSVAAVFVIPVLVRDPEHSANPFQMLQKSATCLRRTWGEALIGYVGLGFINTMITLASFLFLGAAFGVSVLLSNFFILAAAGVCWLVGMVVWSYLAGVASQVYRGALYLYAAEGIVAQPYSQEMFDLAWKFKK